MSKTATCGCGHRFQIQVAEGISEIHCPVCGQIVETANIHHEVSDTAVTPHETDPGNGSVDAVQVFKPPMLLQMLLNPKTIERLLVFGGGLSVLGLIAWLISLGVFDDPRILAVTLGAGTLALLAGGWGVSLRTTRRLAGQALTFLACVVAPLNLWFYDAQGLLTVDGHLWVGGLVCSLLYLLTVWKLRDPLFLYAVEAGITLTVLLLLGDLQRATDSSALCLTMVVLSLISIHAEAAFDRNHPVFNRRRFGLPLFFSGQAQLGIGMISLLVLQILNWTFDPAVDHWSYSRIATTPWMAGSLWLAAAYLWSYSDLAVRRLSIYTYLAALAVVLAEITFLYPVLPLEVLIIALSMTALAAQFMITRTTAIDSRLFTVVGNVAAIIGVVTFGMGMIRHLQSILPGGNNPIHDPKLFAISMLAIAINLFFHGLAQPERKTSSLASGWTCSALSLWLASMYGLNFIGIQSATDQLPLLMLIPIVIVLLAQRHFNASFVKPAIIAAHVMTVCGLVLSVASVNSMDERMALIRTGAHDRATLFMGLTFLELAFLNFATRSTAQFRLVTLSCGGIWSLAAVWKLLVFVDLPEVWFGPLFAAVGVLLSVIDQLTSTKNQFLLENEKTHGEEKQTLLNAGGSVCLVIGELIAFFQTLPLLFVAIKPIPALSLTAILLTAALSLVASILSPANASRSWHRFASVMIAAAISLAWIRSHHFADYQKLELALEALGIAWLVAGFAGRLNEEGETRSLGVTWALWAGSLLATFPVFCCTLMHRLWSGAPSLGDELGLITVTVLMVAIGCVLQIRSTTSVGGAALGLYLAVLFGNLVYHPQIAVGVYLAAGGGIIFLTGVVLSIYRDRLLALPSNIAHREGIFQWIDWR